MSEAPEARRGRRLSVAVVTDAIHPYHRGGKESRYYQLLPRLNQRCDARLYTMHWWPERTKTIVDQGVPYEAITRLVALYKSGRRSIVQALVFAVGCLRLLTKRFDVVEADHMPYLQIVTLWLVTRIRRRPLVVTWNEVWGPEYWRTYLGGLSGAIAWWIERVAMSCPDEILAVSEGTAARLRSYVGNAVPIRVIPNAIDLDMIGNVPPAPPESSADLLYVGRLMDHKGVGQLIEAVALLGPDLAARVLIVGNGPEKEKLEQQVRDAGLSEVVNFRSDVADSAEVFALMKSAKVFVFPSVREGFGIAVLEALACGTRVITTSHPDELRAGSGGPVGSWLSVGAQRRVARGVHHAGPVGCGRRFPTARGMDPGVRLGHRCRELRRIARDPGQGDQRGPAGRSGRPTRSARRALDTQRARVGRQCADGDQGGRCPMPSNSSVPCCR